MNKELSLKFAKKFDGRLLAGEKITIDVYDEKMVFSILAMSKMKSFEDDAYIFLVNEDEAKSTPEGRAEFMKLLSYVNANEIEFNNDFVNKTLSLKHVIVAPMVVNFSLAPEDVNNKIQEYKAYKPFKQEIYYTWKNYCKSPIYSTYITFYKLFAKQLGKEFVDEINLEFKDLIKQKWLSEKGTDWPEKEEKAFDKDFYKTFKDEIKYYEQSEYDDES